MSESKVKITPASAAAHDGILFVSVMPNGKEPTTAGHEDYEDLVAATIEFSKVAFAETSEKAVKVTLGRCSIEVHKEPNCIVAMAFEIGAPVVKSAQRMMRKLAIASGNLSSKPKGDAPKIVLEQPATQDVGQSAEEAAP